MTTLKMHLDDIWNQVKNLIKQSHHFDDAIYEAYFDKSFLADLNENKATVGVETYFQQIILNEEVSIINQHLESVLSIDGLNTEIVIHNKDSNLNTISLIENYNKEVIKSDGIMENQTFENFVVGSSNKESHSAALGCAYKPGLFFTPLFIYGNSGLGKTHLLHAIGNFVKKNNENAKVLYISSSNFVNNVVNSLQRGVIEDFKNQMNDLDVLLIDDIQFLAGKEKSHEIFFNIFNQLINNQKQIVITSDRLPTDIKGLEERLISRFSSGLSVGVDSPEFETALAILKMKIKNRSIDDISFDEDALTYIASNFNDDVRRLEGALNRLLFYSIEFDNSNAISLEMTMNAFKGELEPVKKLDAKTIKRIVADYYGLTISQLVGKSRTKAISNARHIAIYLTRKHLDLPYNKIGDEFGKRDHSTIISAYDKIEKNLRIDHLLQTAIIEIENKFN